jgi:PRD1 phage membrane DNA delivery
MNQLTETALSIGVLIVGLAVVSVLVSQKSQTPQVIGAASSAFSNALSAATAPVTGAATAPVNSSSSGGFSIPSFSQYGLPS